MKLASYRWQNKDSFGAVIDGGIVDLTKRLKYPDLHSVIAAGALWVGNTRLIDNVRCTPPQHDSPRDGALA